MIVVGLTGSIGMGKSTVAAMFRDDGVPVFDADSVVHVLQGPGGTLLAAIEATFPGTTGDGGVDRKKLGTIVFGDPRRLASLEAIVHPAVAEARIDFMRAHAHAPIVVVDIPLLFEKGGTPELDTVVVVSAPVDVQRERVLARPGMTSAKFAHILGLQMPDEEKRARADHVIDTGTTLAATRAQVRAVIACLTATKAQ